MAASLAGWDNTFTSVYMLGCIGSFVVILPLKAFLIHQLSDYNTAFIYGGIASLLLSCLFILNERSYE